MNILQRAVLTALLLAAVLCVQSQSLSKQDFLSPPRSARPSTYWMWMNGNITKEGLTQDLEQMHRANYGAAMMFNAGVGIPRGPIDYASSAWDELTLHAVKEAERLGMELYLQNSPGYSGTGGPWMRPEESMQQLEWTEEIAIPDKKGIISLTLPRPYAKMNYYRDAMVLAYPSLEEETTTWAHLITRVLLNGKEVDKAFLTDNDLGTQIRLQKEEVLVVELSTPFCAEAVTVRRGTREQPLDPHDGPRDYAPVLSLEQTTDGVHFTKVASINCPALRAMDTPGVASFPSLTATTFRLTTNRDTNLSELTLHSTPRLAGWPAKTNYVKDGVSLADNKQQVSSASIISADKVIDLTRFMDGKGQLNWDTKAQGLPQHTRWTIVRIGSTTTGEVVAACPDSGLGLDCDKMSATALDTHFDRFLDPLLTKLKPYCGTTLTTLMMDSWEAGKQNWTPRLPEEFRARRGYDLMPWMLAMTGRVVAGVDETERFLFDMRRTQTDLFNDCFLARFKERAARFGLKFAGEPYGDGNFESLEYSERLDYPMGEFWIHNIYGGVTTSKMAASTAHLWNRPIVGAECFTGTPFNSKFTEHPSAMKALGDYMMTVGINRFVYHVYAHQPYTGPTPGIIMTMGPFGTHLNRNSTWAEASAAWTLYNGRCAYMLQQGRYVADILYLKNEAISNGIDDYDCNVVPTPYGYRWDVGSRNVLPQLTMKDGRLTLPHGMSYRLLVLPPMEKTSPELLRQVLRLVKEGAIVVLAGPKPQGYMGRDADKDKEVQRLSDELWRSGKLGKGLIYCTSDLKQVLTDIAVQPDFSFVAENRDAQIHFIHRAVGEEEVYFVANHRRRPELLTATFRVNGLVPELWDAETGETSIPVAYTEVDGMTQVTLQLTESGSTFVVFRKQAHSNPSQRKGEQRACEVLPMTQSDGNFSISLWAKPETFAAGGRGFLLYPMPGESSFGSNHAYVGLSMGQNTVRVHERATTHRTVLECNTPIEGWTHVALVYNGGTPTLYLNGKVVATGKTSSFICHPALELPQAEEQYFASFEGDQTTTQYVPRVLSPEEIQTQFTTGLPAPLLPENFALLRPVTGEWHVQFPPWSKAPAEIVLPALHSLHKHADFNVKHFSGTATYIQTLRITKKELKQHTSIYLDLGRVENLAEVSINGSKPVLLWKAPYRINVTAWLKPGDNELKIAVTNLYPNRMIGDEHLPEKYNYDEYGRIRQFPVWYTNSEPDTDRQRILFSPWKHYTKEEPLLEAGLLGPVRLVLKRGNNPLFYPVFLQ